MKNKPLAFILLFAGTYIVLNILYQGILYLYTPLPDPFTILVCKTTLLFTPELDYRELIAAPGLLVSEAGKPLVNIKEGCNGIAVWISLLSFIIAFRSDWMAYLVFIPLSFFLIQVCNVFRLFVLIKIKLLRPAYFDFFHVYAFPAIIYLIAFLLMVGWVKLFVLPQRR